MNEDMYQENILEHYKNPSNFGSLKEYDKHARELNPLCGDEIEMFLVVEDNKVKDVKFKGSGCAISTASCSMLTENIIGKNIDELKNMNKDSIFNMLGIKISHARIKCALLGLSVMQQAISQNNK